MTTGTIERADETLRAGCGLLDRSERGKLALTGEDAATLLQGLVTNDVEALSPGEGCYAALLTPKGKMLADLRVLRTERELWLDTERPALQALFDALRRGALGHRAELHKRTLQQGLLSLVGPASRRVAGAPGPAEAENASAPAHLGGREVLLVTTDVGLDVICAAQDTVHVRAALEGAGAVPVPVEAVETLRVEHGRPRHGVDIDEGTIPEEAGLNERAVSFTKGCYVGQETVARLHYKGRPNRRLSGLRLSGPAPTGAELRLGDRPVGRLGSVVRSPRHGDIALALVRREAAPGDTVAVGDGSTTARVVELPFEG